MLTDMQNQSIENVLYDPLISTTNLDSLIKGYMLNCEADGKSPTTISGYQMLLKKFSWYCCLNEYPPPQKFTAAHIRGFLEYLTTETHRWNSHSPRANRPVNKTTVNCYYRALHSFFNWLYKEELIPTNPFDHLKTPEPEGKVIQALTPKEINRLLQTCSAKTAHDVRNKAILSVFLDCGFRISELASLTLQDVNTDDGSMLIRQGKGGKQRVVRIGNKAQKILWKYLTLYRRSTSNHLFINRYGEPLDVLGIKMLIKRLGDRAKVKVHPHKLRHTFAISYLRSGGDVFSLQYLLGHSTLQMTQRYFQSLNAEDAMNAHRKYSPLDNLEV